MNDSKAEKYSSNASGSALGKETTYDHCYNPNHLYPIPRLDKRKEIGVNVNHLPFTGFDCWNHYELSWLNQKGKPLVATAEIYYHCHSPFIVESKSLKLYLNSFNNTPFLSADTVAETIVKDLEAILESPVFVTIHPLKTKATMQSTFAGESIDNIDISCSEYTVNPSLLSTNHAIVEETLHSDLLKSNCLITNQPDWGSVQIHYEGKQINRAGLLRYIVSFRNHNEFHEQCIERIFIDIMRQCSPKKLTVYGRYTRRGGLDINPYRSTEKTDFHNMNIRLVRQ